MSDWISSLRTNNEHYPVGLLFYSDGRFILTDRNGDELPGSIASDVRSAVTDESYTRVKEAQENSRYQRKASSRKRAKDNDYPGYIYAVCVGDKIKIGRTKSPETRLRTYKKAFENYRLLGIYQASRSIAEEASTLKRFGGAQSLDEWIKRTDSLEAEVKQFFEIHSTFGDLNA